jgi:hypothetical protein
MTTLTTVLKGEDQVQRCNERREEKEGVLDSTQMTKTVPCDKIRADNFGSNINVFLFKEVSCLEPHQNYALGTAPLMLLFACVHRRLRPASPVPQLLAAKHEEIVWRLDLVGTQAGTELKQSLAGG